MLRKKNIIDWLLAILCFMLFQPFFLWGNIIVYYIIYLLILVLLLSIWPIRRLNISNVNLFLILLYLYIASCYVIKPGGFILLILIYTIGFASLLLVDKLRLSSIFRKFTYVFLIFMIPAAVEYILVTYLGINTPSKTIMGNLSNPHENSTYYRHLFYVSEVFLNQGNNITRFYGVFDEPGVVGTICMVILFANKFNLHDKCNIIVLILGLMSLSLFFIVSIVAYCMILGNNKLRIVFIIIGLIFCSLLFKNEFVSSYLVNRIIANNGNLMIQRENYDFVDFYNNMSLFNLLFGTSHVPSFSTTYKYMFVMCGIVPIFTFILLLFIKARNTLYYSKDILVYILIPIFVLSQRPFINSFCYLFLIITPLYIIANSESANDSLVAT